VTKENAGIARLWSAAAGRQAARAGVGGDTFDYVVLAIGGFALFAPAIRGRFGSKAGDSGGRRERKNEPIKAVDDASGWGYSRSSV